MRKIEQHIEQPGFMNLPEHYKRWVEINSSGREINVALSREVIKF
jgi:hypothetical protein